MIQRDRVRLKEEGAHDERRKGGEDIQEERGVKRVN